MTLRNASGKFSLPFGRKASSTNPQVDTTISPPESRVTSGTYPTGVGSGGGGDNDSLHSPRGTSHFSIGGTSGGGGTSSADGGGPNRLDGIGRKLGKSLAHTSLIPALGNQDLRLLQDVISSEKGVMTSAEKLAVDMQTAATKLQPYGTAEGDDLRDVLTHSGTLLNQLSIALRTFAQHEASLRTCFKRVRQREETLDEIRRRRRTTGQKAESAERKLAKMGPENKQLLSQTELLESLRHQMRQLDSDIVNEEAKLGDYKRQAIKEALSFKFGGLEELGEKMCIIGELGKLLLEEIPLEETPPGYGRAPYTAQDRTENTVTEAVKCLATVQFHAGSAAPKPPGLPRFSESGSLGGNSFAPGDRGSHSVADHEAYENLPGIPTSPPTLDVNLPRGAAGTASGDAAYGGIEDRYNYNEFGASKSPPAGNNVMWQGPTDEQLNTHDYEYEQQRQMDEAAAATAAAEASGAAHNPGWQPLRVSQHERSATGTSLSDGPIQSHQSRPPLGLNEDAFEPLSSDSWLAPADPHAQRPHSSNSGYFTPDEDQGNNPRKASVPSDVRESIQVTTPPILQNSPPQSPPSAIIPPIPTVSFEDPSHETSHETPRGMASTLPAAGGYVPPLAPPMLSPNSEHFDRSVSNEHESFYAPDTNNPRISTSTFNVPHEVPRDVRDSMPASVNSGRDSFATYRESYATFNPRDSVQSAVDDAVVVTIPAEPLRTATPTLHTRMQSSHQSQDSNASIATIQGAGTSNGGAGPTISAAAFRRTNRRERPSVSHDSMSDDGSGSFGHDAAGGAAAGGPRRLPQAPSSGTDSPVTSSFITEQHGYENPPPSYDDDTGALR